MDFTEGRQIFWWKKSGKTFCWRWHRSQVLMVWQRWKTGQGCAKGRISPKLRYRDGSAGTVHRFLNIPLGFRTKHISLTIFITQSSGTNILVLPPLACSIRLVTVSWWACAWQAGWEKVRMDKKTSLMGGTTSELKIGSLLLVFLAKSCSPGQWPGAFGLKGCSVYVTTHSLYKEFLVKSANLSILVTVSSNKHLTKKTKIRLGVWEGTGQTSWAVLFLLNMTFSLGGKDANIF